MTLKFTVRLSKALSDRIKTVAGENQVAEFIRSAAEAELKRRERQKPKPSTEPDA